MTHLFNRLKRDLYAEYEDQLTELVEGRRGNEPLPPEEAELQQQVPEHLRISYARQQLLSLRAAKVDPCPLKCCEHTEEAPQAVPRSWDVKEAEQIEWEHQMEDALEAKQRELLSDKANPDLAHMRRLQSESLRRLRQSVLEQEQHKQHKRERLAAEGSEAGTAETAGGGEGGADDPVAKENLQIVKEGGCYGRAFTAQRMNILDKLDRQLREEQLARKVHDM